MIFDGKIFGERNIAFDTIVLQSIHWYTKNMLITDVLFLLISNFVIDLL